MITRFLNWFRCSFGECIPEPEGEPFNIGDTTAPYPAVDELRQAYRCKRCGKRTTRYAGFIFDSE
jgi:hypothetical protein